MRVKDLIVQLSKCNPDAVVVTRDYDGCNHPCITIDNINIVPKGSTPSGLTEVKLSYLT